MKKVVLGIILAVASSHVFAQDLMIDQKGWFVGGGIGTVKLSINPKNQSGLYSDNEDSTLFTAFAGYNYTNWFGIEFDISKSSDFTDVNTQLDAYVLGSSFTPKFTYHLNDNFAMYFKAGLQYVAYEQSVSSAYYDEITWNGIDPVFGAGVQYSFESGGRIRLDYKYSKLTLDRSENNIFGFNFYDDEIDLDFNALTLTVNYQF